MLMVQDIRQTRVYQEAREEGKKEGIEQGRHEGIEQGRHEGIEQGRHEGIEQGIAIAKLAAGNKSIAEIAAALRIDPEFVRQVLAKMK